MGIQLWLVVGCEAAVFALILFVGAGTWRWPAGWVFLGMFFSGTAVLTRDLARNDPALLKERLKPPIQKSQPFWDRVLLATLLPLFVVWLALMAVDAVRFRWSHVPAWLQGVGAAGVLVSQWMWQQIFQTNTFLAPVVKIQTERKQTVVTTGPYAIVRHPLYATMVVFLPSTSFLLGSWYGLALGALMFVPIVVRTALEDRELQRNLDGYREYAERVRYRLVPWVW